MMLFTSWRSPNNKKLNINSNNNLFRDDHQKIVTSTSEKLTFDENGKFLPEYLRIRSFSSSPVTKKIESNNN